MTPRFVTRLTQLGIAASLVMGLPLAGLAGELTLEPTIVPVMKSVFGQVQSRRLVPARARIGGTITTVQVEEGDQVATGQVIAVIIDDKIALQRDALQARQLAVTAQLENAKVSLTRVRTLFARGTVSQSRLDEQTTQVSVLTNQLQEVNAQLAVNRQQSREGKVKAPAAGRVVSVPITQGSVILPGETIARIAGGGYFLRLSLPERHAARLQQGRDVLVEKRGLAGPQSAATTLKGRLAKIYPEIENGRVIADVEVSGLGDFFVGERTLVSIQIGERQVIAVPPNAIATRYGIDYVTVLTRAGEAQVSVVVGDTYSTKNGQKTEILSGLRAGDRIVAP